MVSRVVGGNIVFGRCSLTVTAGTRVGSHIHLDKSAARGNPPTLAEKFPKLAHACMQQVNAKSKDGQNVA